MSDRQKALLSLTLASESCKAALNFLSDPSFSEPPPVASDLTVVHNDFISLLSLLHASVTKVSLSLKPSSPTYSASLTPLKNTSDHVSALAHCVRLIQDDYGITLRAEFESVAKDVLDSVRSFVQTFILIEAEGTTTKSTGNAGDEYMVRTGAVHEMIEKARTADGVSKDNVAAVRKIWLKDYESLADGLDELREICESADSANDGLAEEEPLDDGWDELGLGSSSQLSQQEIERAKKVQAIIHLSNLLHKRVSTELLPSLSRHSPLPKSVNKSLDSLARCSPELLSVSDELISSMYAPQNVDIVTEALDSFQEVIQDIRPIVIALIPESSLDEKLGSLDISNTSKASTGSRKWFETCLDHTLTAIQKMKNMLESAD